MSEVVDVKVTKKIYPRRDIFKILGGLTAGALLTRGIASLSQEHGLNTDLERSVNQLEYLQSDDINEYKLLASDVVQNLKEDQPLPNKVSQAIVFTFGFVEKSTNRRFGLMYNKEGNDKDGIMTSYPNVDIAPSELAEPGKLIRKLDLGPGSDVGLSLIYPTRSSENSPDSVTYSRHIDIRELHTNIERDVGDVYEISSEGGVDFQLARAVHESTPGTVSGRSYTLSDIANGDIVLSSIKIDDKGEVIDTHGEGYDRLPTMFNKMEAAYNGVQYVDTERA